MIITGIYSPIKSHINFTSTHKQDIENFKNNKVGYLVHSSGFFRYDRYSDTKGPDETAIDYLKKMFGANSVFNIVSAGCSYGEEPYGFALALNSCGKQANISAFDISEEAIAHAKDGTYKLDSEEEKHFLNGYQHSIYGKKLSPFREKMRDNFLKNFELIDSKKLIYKKKKGFDDNCKFFSADLRNIGEIYPQNSQHLVLCRYVLYHHNQKEEREILEQIYKVLKPAGLLCISPNECSDYVNLLKKIGFRQIFPDMPCIFQKPRSSASMFYD